MTDLQTAAQQALEFCEFLWREVVLNDWAEGQREATEAALRAALAEQQEQAEPDTCTWQQDGDSDSGVYGTSCGSYFHLEDGTPEDNKMAWCCYCGKRLAQELITEDNDD